MKVKIIDEIGKKLEKRVNDLEEFKTVEEYINYILKQVVERLEDEDKIEKDDSKDDVYSEEDEKKVKERLRNLGYLD